MANMPQHSSLSLPLHHCINMIKSYSSIKYQTKTTMNSKSKICLLLFSLLLASPSIALGRTEWEQGKQGRENPYVFEDRHFITGLQSQHGRLRILPKFTERSELLRGVENYRVTIFEAEPQTFIVPSYWDAHSVYFVAKGKGTVYFVHQDRKEIFNIRQGDIVRVKAGTTTYLVNSGKNERLIMAKVLVPVNAPGEFQSYFGVGTQSPESFYKAFSSEILEAAFNTRSDKVQRLFGQQKQGFIIKASEEQIRSLSRHEEGGVWPFRGESRSTFNLYQQRPTHSNQYGQLYEVDSSQFRQLKDLGISVSLANITQGAMTALGYNSKATKITIVVEGEGYFEMACPHISQSQGGRQSSQEQEQGSSQGGRQGSQEQEQGSSQGGRQGSQEQEQGSSQGGRQGSQEQEQGSWRGTSRGPQYQRVSSRLKRGTVVVVPAGHPFVAVASNNQNLQLLCFEVNARNNEKFTLSGRRNVLNQLEKEAKELAFGIPAREVDEVFRSQQEEYFVKGPRQEQHQGRADE